MLSLLSGTVKRVHGLIAIAAVTLIASLTTVAAAPPTYAATSFSYPADATFVQVTGTGQVYRIAGGAAVPATSWPAVGLRSRPANVRWLSAADFARMHTHLKDGTFIKGYATGQVYRMIGGAPTYVTGPAWRSTLSKTTQARGMVTVDQAAIDRAGQTGVWTHILKFPVDDKLFIAFNGSYSQPYYTTNFAPIADRSESPIYPETVALDYAAVTHAGQGGVWSHLWGSCDPVYGNPGTEMAAFNMTQTQTSCHAAQLIGRYAISYAHSRNFTYSGWRCTQVPGPSTGYPHHVYTCASGSVAKVKYWLND